MSKELDCKWHFGLEAPGNEKGPNNSTKLSFGGTKYHSLIREAIQNSLDAVDDKAKPVTVSFDYSMFEGRDLPQFFKLNEHIKGCLDRWPEDENAKKQFRSMQRFFASSINNQEMGYLRIKDTNTTGMHYDATNPTNSQSTFHAFLSEGSASKQDNKGAGGSFGFGKAVFWVVSPISTVFVSSKTDTQTNFVGQTKLCTHYHSASPGTEFVSNGLYSTNGEGKIITEEHLIPEMFRTNEKGTSIYVLGAPYIDKSIRKELVEAVLRNFWMAIYREKLIVKIDHGRIVIDKEHLSELMNSYFEDSSNNNKKENFEYNPRYFYEIVVNAENGSSDEYKKLEGKVEMKGSDIPITLYIHKQQDAKQFVFMRSPLMTVYTERTGSYKGVDGVFVCDDEKGNNHLREMEDWKHDSWTKENYIARKNNDPKEAASTLKAIKEYIKDVIKTELRQDAPDTQQIAGLDKILTISTPKGADDGSKKDDIVDPENLSNKKKEKQPKTKSKAKPVVRHPREAKAKFDEQGRWLSNNGGKRKKRPLKPGPSKPGSMGNKSKEAPDGVTGIYAVPINVGYRTWSQVEEGQVWHIIRIFSKTDIDNAIIEVYGVDDEGRAIGLNIVEVDGNYEIRSGEEFVDNTDFEDTDFDSKAASKQVKNAIGNVRIEAQKPKTLKVRFNSNIKYSLRINTDKVETNESE